MSIEAGVAQDCGDRGNFGSSRKWDGDTPEAAQFWGGRIVPMPEEKKRDVETFPP